MQTKNPRRRRDMVRDWITNLEDRIVELEDKETLTEFDRQSAKRMSKVQDLSLIHI